MVANVLEQAEEALLDAHELLLIEELREVLRLLEELRGVLAVFMN